MAGPPARTTVPDRGASDELCAPIRPHRSAEPELHVEILVLSPFVPDAAAMSGAPRAIFDRLEILARRHDVTLLTLQAPDEPAAVEGLSRLRQVVRIPRNVVGPDAPRTQRWRKRARLATGLAINGRPSLVQEFRVQAFCAAAGRLAAEGPAVVFAEHILCAQYLRCVRRPGVACIVSDHDIDGPAPASGGGVAGSVLRPLEGRAWSRYRSGAFRSADAVVVPTQEDAERVGSYGTGTPVAVIPFGLQAPDSDVASVSTTPPVPPVDVLFVGNFEHAPNRDAAWRLCRLVMPLVWERRPETSVAIVGRRPTEAIHDLASDRVRVLGEVPSVAPHLASCTLFVAPIRQGGGTRMKLIEAMRAGVAIVTTPLGARGLDATPGRDLLVADSDAEIADAIVDLLTQPARRDALALAARRAVLDPDRQAARADRLDALMDLAIAEARRGERGGRRERGGREGREDRSTA